MAAEKEVGLASVPMDAYLAGLNTNLGRMGPRGDTPDAHNLDKSLELILAELRTLNQLMVRLTTSGNALRTVAS